MLDKELKYFIDNQVDLYEKYPNKFLVIKDCEIKFSGETFDDALCFGVKNYKLGTFLIQECVAGSGAYTQTFHSRVSFAQ